VSPDDLLARATRAARAESDRAPPEVARTRARVLATSSRHARRRVRFATLAPLAAALAVSTAWAGTNGWLAQTWQGLRSVVRPAVSESPRSSPERTFPVAERSAPPPAEELPTRPERPGVPVVAVESLPRVTPRVSGLAPLATGVVTPAPESEPAEPSESDGAGAGEAPLQDEASLLYAAAHRAHFVERDPGAALRAWDAYLRAAPTGALVPEARYNRALTLVRLGRRDEARAALSPFVDGTYGTYRAREAREILGALGR
jgi:hypothetical protein